jgi:hypothetical protein
MQLRWLLPRSDYRLIEVALARGRLRPCTIVRVRVGPGIQAVVLCRAIDRVAQSGAYAHVPLEGDPLPRTRDPALGRHGSDRSGLSTQQRSWHRGRRQGSTTRERSSPPGWLRCLRRPREVGRGRFRPTAPGSRDGQRQSRGERLKWDQGARAYFQWSRQGPSGRTVAKRYWRERRIGDSPDCVLQYLSPLRGHDVLACLMPKGLTLGNCTRCNRNLLAMGPYPRACRILNPSWARTAFRRS